MKVLYLLMVLGFLSSCHDSSSRQTNYARKKIVPTEPLANSIKVVKDDAPVLSNKKCPIDTVALLTNARLDYLLTKTHQENLKDYKRIEDIPPHVLSYLKCISGGNFSIAAQGMPWNSTCDIDEALPDRELDYLGIGKTITLITYSTGGFGRIKHVIIIESKNGNIKKFWNGAIDHQAKSKLDIINNINDKQNEPHALRRILYNKRHVLNRMDTTISAFEKSTIIDYYLAI